MRGSFATASAAAIALFVAAAGGTADAAGEFEDIAVTIAQPGGGFLISDGSSIVPLEMYIRSVEGPLELRNVRVRAALGKVRRTRIMGDGRVSFAYSPPKKRRPINEILDVTLTLENGDEQSEAFPIDVRPVREPGIQLRLDPSEFDATRPQDIALAAVADGDSLEHLEIITSHGGLESAPAKRTPSRQLERRGTLSPPAHLPVNAPSHFLLIAVTSGRFGFAARSAGISVLAPIRVSATVRPGSLLALEGTEWDVPPQRAPADGKTVIEGVVRYGATIRAFAKRGRRRQEVPVVVPSGMVPVALAAAIPGQDVADGGTGPTILVAVPPSPFGDEMIWPDIAVEGAQLVDTIELDDDLRALVLQRPTDPRPITITADDAAVETFDFGPGHGAYMEIREDYTKAGERGAVYVSVTDPLGTPTSRPTPKAWIEAAEKLPIEAVGTGKYRIVLPPTIPGRQGDEVDVSVELPPPPVIAGDPAELVTETITLKLEGTPPALHAEGGSKPKPKKPKKRKKKPSLLTGVELSLSASAMTGATVGADLLYGGGAAARLNLPVWARRISLRAGVEYARMTSDGKVTFGDNLLDASTVIAGVVVPLDVGVIVFRRGALELAVFGGLALRFESGVLEIDTKAVDGDSRFGAGARVTAEIAWKVGKGALIGELGVGGIGASADGLTSTTARLEGSLAHLRLALGFRVGI